MILCTDIPGVSMQVSREVIVASIQVDLDNDVLARFRKDLLHRIYATGSRGVILDLSGDDYPSVLHHASKQVAGNIIQRFGKDCDDAACIPVRYNT